MGFLDQVRQKLELRRLENRYTRREKRTTFVSGAQYVDGEYIFPSESSYSSPAASPSVAAKGPFKWTPFDAPKSPRSNKEDEQSERSAQNSPREFGEGFESQGQAHGGNWNGEGKKDLYFKGRTLVGRRLSDEEGDA